VRSYRWGKAGGKGGKADQADQAERSTPRAAAAAAAGASAPAVRCGRLFQSNEIVYRCKTCGVDPTCVMWCEPPPPPSTVSSTLCSLLSSVGAFFCGACWPIRVQVTSARVPRGARSASCFNEEEHAGHELMFYSSSGALTAACWPPCCCCRPAATAPARRRHPVDVRWPAPRSTRVPPPPPPPPRRTRIQPNQANKRQQTQVGADAAMGVTRRPGSRAHVSSPPPPPPPPSPSPSPPPRWGTAGSAAARPSSNACGAAPGLRGEGGGGGGGGGGGAASLPPELASRAVELFCECVDFTLRTARDTGGSAVSLRQSRRFLPTNTAQLHAMLFRLGFADVTTRVLLP
jgi:hypothetical protein